MVRTKRAYAPVDPGDGRRILVDRLWPRGVSKSRVGIDEWLRDLGPSAELRVWFGHDPSRWDEFKRRYRRELSSPIRQRMMEEIARRSRHETVTLIYGSRDTRHNNAVVLQEIIDSMVEEDGE